VSAPEFYREFFYDNYAGIMERQRVPLVYSHQSYDAVKDSGLHLHEDHYALYIVQSGRGVHEISGHPYGITRGDVYLGGPGSVHAYRDCENLEVEVFVFVIQLFQDDEIAALRALSGFRGLFASRDDGNWSTHRLHLPPQRWEEIERKVNGVREEIMRSREECAPDAAILARTRFFDFLVTLARWWNEQRTPQTPGAVSYRNVELAEVLRFCEAHFREPISVPQLAARMFLSPSRFSEIWKREMGVPPGEYLRRLRLNRAQELLKTTKHSASDIAHDCGFSDATQFSRAFRSAFGITPSDYRKTIKNSHR
jgi:AraC-like DNA-binding protein